MSEQEVEDSPRENLIETAVKFLQNPKVRSSPFDSRMKFLKKKGLTDAEVDIAMRQSGTGADKEIQHYKENSTDTINQALSPVATQPPTQVVVSKWSTVKDYTATAIVIGGIAYGIVFVYRNYIVPYLFGQSQEERQLQQLNKSISQLQQSMVDIVHTLEETQRTLSQQQEHLQQIATNVSLNKGSSDFGTVQDNYALNEVKEEIKSLKGLLLSRKQFPPAPPTTPVIPSWQLTTTLNQTSNDSITQEISNKEPTREYKATEEKMEAHLTISSSKLDTDIQNGVLSVNSSDDEEDIESKTNQTVYQKPSAEIQQVVSQVQVEP